MVKKFFSILLAGTIIFSLSACGKTSTEENQNISSVPDEKEAVSGIPAEENTDEEFMESNQSISLKSEEHKAMHRYFQLESEKEMIEGYC